MNPAEQQRIREIAHLETAKAMYLVEIFQYLCIVYQSSITVLPVIFLYLC